MSFQTEAVVNPGATFAGNTEGSIEHAASVLEFGDEGSTTRVKNAAGNRLPVQVAQGLSAVGVVAGQISLSGVAAQLSTVAARRFRLKAHTENTDVIYLGPSGVTTSTGFPLWPSDEIEVEVSNLDVLFAIVGAGTQKLCYLGHV